ncbi:NitT/TauT family transport system substrate-binding protein [Dongia mobilis]|uniref:Thiamine pyrimidine synthase n=1 Tax=Dongia mobilis TaxID=578943 RepID=A0A4V3DEN2_9PROT|nr:NitT/TauT family transport system substrate-binding protein [Dongia mobilis]
MPQHPTNRIFCTRPALALLGTCLTALSLAILPASPASAQSPEMAETAIAQAARPVVSVQLPPGPGLRHIGLLLAARRGYFTAAGIDVVLQQSAPGQSPVVRLDEGNTDLAIDIMPAALRARAEGRDVVHVAQLFQRATLSLVCRPAIDQPGKLAGENVGVWLGGWESSFYAWLNRLGLSYFASGGGVTVLRQGQDAELFLAGEADCMTTTTYLAPMQLAALGEERARLVTWQYEELGLGVLEDGLYVRREALADPVRVDAYARFLSAALRGWQVVLDNPREAERLLAGLPENAEIGGAVIAEALGGIAAALPTDGEVTGRLDMTAYDRTINLLLTGAPEPVLRAAPDGALSDILLAIRSGRAGQRN